MRSVNLRRMTMNNKLTRYRIYRSRESREYLCVCAARDKRHALQIARQNFQLGRGAQAALATATTAQEQK
jgi:hypothetical protein